MRRYFSWPVCRAVAMATALSAAAIAIVATAMSGPFPWEGAEATSAVADFPAAQGVASGTPMFPLLGRQANGHLYDYEPKGTAGGVQAAVDLGGGFSEVTAIMQANVSQNGTGNDLYYRMGGSLYYTAERGNDTKLIGGGWGIYNMLAAVNRGSTAQPEIIGRDAAGALWVYPVKADGVLGEKVKIGSGGWDKIDRITGRGDYTGDGKPDMIARDTGGTLYLYPGTGSATADASINTRITVGTGWGSYNLLVSTGDNDGDGKADLIATDKAGALWLFKGTGNPNSPFAARVQIGTRGWDAFNTLF
ncbi:FG-GAP-like repeat-containing protein [Streptomyces celluloflavus]|uniref:FG-GAP-like repeat-containing protein n=1 Tax=Streptomyces celluloflavus TaxID=58344 RepID=UPI0036823784